MCKVRGHASRAAALLLLATATSTAAEVTTKAIGGASPSLTGSATCPSRSVNYITHSLPQQCLTTSWASKPKIQDTSTDQALHTTIVNNNQSQGNGNATIAISTLQTHSAVAASSLTVISTASTATESQETAFRFSPSTTATQPEATLELETETESDSPLDNANFLSFEEWKRQNLAKAGQSAENLGARAGNAGNEPRRRPGGITNALDSLGEDSEIEIDFGGFVNPDASAPTGPLGNPNIEGDKLLAKDERGEAKPLEEPSGVRRRSKDAGKTCKERSNYASFDCAATVLKTNPECKGSNAVLVENKDSYMLNICSAKNKFFIVELCDDILIDTVVLANFEFFSSMFRTFRISVSDRYPVKLDKWKELGTFEARNSREVQAFLVENPLIWARYLRVELLTHFGNEYYCPISLIRVHGTTMMEEFNHDLKRSGTEEESETEVGEGEEGSIDAVPDVVSAEALKEQAVVTSVSAEAVSTAQDPTTNTATRVEVPANTSAIISATASSVPKQAALQSFSPYNFSFPRTMEDRVFTSDGRNAVCVPEDKPEDVVLVQRASSNIDQSTIASEVVDTSISPITNQITSIQAAIVTGKNAIQTPEPATTISPAVSDRNSPHSASEPLDPANQSPTATTKIQTSSTQPPNGNPTTQESFFKSVHKRLQLLESNSTLSLQYIEEQSRILRDAFAKVEKRQLAKTTTFLETLNTTVLTELRDFRTQYDQIWQSTVLELSSQREQSQYEVFALSARLSLLADEIVFQKRMAILQFILILLCLGLVIFSRHGSSANTYPELPPKLQNALNRSSANLSRFTPQFESPPASPSSTRPSSRYGLFRSFTHRHSPSGESQKNGVRNGATSPSIEYSPPTPTSQDSPESRHGKTEDDSSDSPSDGRGDEGWQTKSSPATPSGRRAEPNEYVAEAGLEPGARKENQVNHVDRNDVR